MINKMLHLLLSVIVVSLIGLVIPSAFAENVPDWVKNNAGWWADGLIDDRSFVSGIEWLVSNGIIVVEDELIHTDVNFRVAFIGDQGLG